MRINSGFCLTYTGPVNPPANQADIPNLQNCLNKNGVTSVYSQTEVLDALAQGAKYALGNQVASTFCLPPILHCPLIESLMQKGKTSTAEIPAHLRQHPRRRHRHLRLASVRFGRRAGIPDPEQRQLGECGEKQSQSGCGYGARSVLVG